jgi:hypothetical protein
LGATNGQAHSHGERIEGDENSSEHEDGELSVTLDDIRRSIGGA